MAERGRDHLLIAGPDHRPRGGVAHPCLYGVLLDPAERRHDRLVVRLDDALVAAHHRHQADGLGRAQRHVPARPVHDAAVDLLAPETAPALACPGPDPGNLAFEHRPEALGIDRPGEAERRRALARPGAGVPVRGVFPGVIAIALEIAHTLRRRGDLADGRYHRRGAPGGTDSWALRLSIRARYAPAGRRTRAERTVSFSSHLLSSHGHNFRRISSPLVLAGVASI